MQVEAEKVEVGAEWSDAECWAEAQKYALQRSGGTVTVQCDLTTITADSTGLNDVSGNALNLTNTGCVNGTWHPSALETLGGGATVLPDVGAAIYAGLAPAGIVTTTPSPIWFARRR